MSQFSRQTSLVLSMLSLVVLLSLLVACGGDEPAAVIDDVSAVADTSASEDEIPLTPDYDATFEVLALTVVASPTPAPPTPVPSETPIPTATPIPSPTIPPTPLPPELVWLQMINDYRAESGLVPLGYSAALSENALLHSEYMGRNDDSAGLGENPGAAYFTPGGSDAAEKSIKFAIDSPDGTDLWALDFWMSAPFDAITLLDPDLKSVGYGRFRDDYGSVQVAYVMDTLSDMEDGSGTTEYPIYYPADGGTSYISNQGFSEYPEPTASCPGYDKPIGPPLILQLGDGSLTPDVTDYRVFVNDVEVEACAFDETNYQGRDSDEQAIGREILDLRDAVVLMPQQPLWVGAVVRAEVTANGETYSWSHTIVEQPFIPMAAIDRSPPDWTVGDKVAAIGSIPLQGFDYGGQTHDLLNPERMQQAGMTWVKFQLKWRSDSVPSEINEKLNRAKSLGFKVLVSVTGDPYPTSIDYDKFVEFMGGMAALSPAPDAIEVWNEMNIDFEWPAGSIDPAIYTEQMLKPSYLAIKNANPEIVVISGAPAPTGFDNGVNAWANSRYMNGMVEAGAVNYMDCIGMHFNEGATPPTATSGHPAGEYFGWYFQPSLQNTFFAFGGIRPICITELGYLSSDGYGGLPGNFWWAEQTSADEHARWLYESLGVAYSAGYVDLAIIFNVDIFHYESDPQGGFAIIRPGGSCPFCEYASQ